MQPMEEGIKNDPAKLHPLHLGGVFDLEQLFRLF